MGLFNYCDDCFGLLRGIAWSPCESGTKELIKQIERCGILPFMVE